MAQLIVPVSPPRVRARVRRVLDRVSVRASVEPTAVIVAVRAVKARVKAVRVAHAPVALAPALRVRATTRSPRARACALVPLRRARATTPSRPVKACRVPLRHAAPVVRPVLDRRLLVLVAVRVAALPAQAVARVPTPA